MEKDSNRGSNDDNVDDGDGDEDDDEDERSATAVSLMSVKNKRG